MARYIVRRLLAAIPVMVVVATTVFLLLFLTPGDPVRVMLGPEATEEQVQQARTQLGLDRPVQEQLFAWYGRLIRGDLGQSLFLNRPVTQAPSRSSITIRNGRSVNRFTYSVKYGVSRST